MSHYPDLIFSGIHYFTWTMVKVRPQTVELCDFWNVLLLLLPCDSAIHLSRIGKLAAQGMCLGKGEIAILLRKCQKKSQSSGSYPYKWISSEGQPGPPGLGWYFSFHFLLFCLFGSSLFFLVSLAKGLSISFIFSENQPLVSIIFSVLNLYFIYFLSGLYYFLPSIGFRRSLFFF